MEIANASGYDGASVCADAVLMAAAIGRKRPKILVSGSVNPAYRKAVATYNYGGENEVEVIPVAGGATDLDALEKALGDDTACVLVQNPNFFGVVEDIEKIVYLAHEAGALVAVSGCPIALGVLKSPGGAGADIAMGEGQPLGVPLSYGGPYLGYFATRDQFKRQLPGRLVGLTEDDRGQEGYVLTLQTREQHIRREKATSNICTNQSLLALAATIHLSLLGKQGLRKVAGLCLQKGHYLAEKISGLKGWKLAWPDAPFFREFAVVPPVAPGEVISALLEKNILAGIDLGKLDGEHDGKLLIAVTEQRTKAQMDAFVDSLKAL
jgi:glycine dehydrogenase subunit 1